VLQVFFCVLSVYYGVIHVTGMVFWWLQVFQMLQLFEVLQVCVTGMSQVAVVTGLQVADVCHRLQVTDVTGVLQVTDVTGVLQVTGVCYRLQGCVTVWVVFLQLCFTGYRCMCYRCGVVTQVCVTGSR